jgi:hypothetical protein
MLELINRGPPGKQMEQKISHTKEIDVLPSTMPSTQHIQVYANNPHIQFHGMYTTYPSLCQQPTYPGSCQQNSHIQVHAKVSHVTQELIHPTLKGYLTRST